MRIKTTCICLAAIGSFLGGSSLAVAEETAGVTLEVITVTANKVEEDITDVPQSITVIDDEVLKEKGIEDIAGIINEIPNMNFDSGVGEGVNFRGLNKSFFTSNNPVVIYIDGVGYSNSSGFDVSLNNVRRIEVLRGPQGTLYGKDAIGAVINIVTKEPENAWHGDVGAQYGSYNAMNGSFNVNGSLIQDKLYLGLNAGYQKDDGWITNDYTGNDEFDKKSNYNLGGFLLYKPTDRFSVKITLSDDHYEGYGLNCYTLPGAKDANAFNRDDAEHVLVDQEGFSETDSLVQSVHLSYEFDSMTLSSATTHRDVAFDSVGDRDNMANTVNDGLVGFKNTDIETWDEELRLSSRNTEGVRWVVGAFFETEDVKKSPIGIQLPLFGSVYEKSWKSDAKSKTMAVFGQTMIPFLDNFELTLGARYQQIDKEMDSDMYFNPAGSHSNLRYSLNTDKIWNSFLPKIALSYKLNSNWTTYTSVAQGYMPGGFNFFASSSVAEDNTFDPQQSTNYEIGIKGNLNRVRLAAAIFYMDIKDIHIRKYDSISDLYVTGNADNAHSLGAELELTYFPTDSVELTAAIGIIDAEYDDYDTGKTVFDGESIEKTPSHTARLGAAYFHPNGFYARGNVTSVGEFPYYDMTTATFREVSSYITADIKIGFRFKGYDIYAYCNNLFDEEYITNFNSTPIKSIAAFGDPRTFGIGVRYSF